MISKISRFLGIFIISLLLAAPVLWAEIEQSKNQTYEQSGYIYVDVYENGKHYIYVYESDGITLVTIIEEEW